MLAIWYQSSHNVSNISRQSNFLRFYSVANHPPIAVYTGDVKSLAAVILRRNISYTAIDSQDIGNAANNENLWKRLSPDAQNFVKNELLKAISECADKNVIHKICNLLIEIGGTIYEQENFVWQDLLNMLFSFVHSE